MEERSKKFILYFLYLVLSLVVFTSAVLIIPVQRKYNKYRSRQLKLKEIAAQKRAECMRLNQEVHDLENSPRAVEKIAREKFGLCKNGELVLRYPKSAKKQNK